jgi:mannose-6-phosphate isomerase-like protein (cupin superfamily)
LAGSSKTTKEVITIRRSMQMEKINLEEKFQLFNEYWSPKILGEVNDSYVKIAKFKGEFTWHNHENEDEMFYIIKGILTVKLRDKDIRLQEGESIIIPKGTEHMPVADEEVHVLLIEPKSTLNTGNVINNKTVEKLERI